MANGASQDLTLRLIGQDVSLTSTFLSASEVIEQLGDDAAQTQAVFAAFAKGSTTQFSKFIGTTEQVKNALGQFTKTSADDLAFLADTLGTLSNFGVDAGLDKNLFQLETADEIAKLQDLGGAIQAVQGALSEGSSAAGLFNTALNTVNSALARSQAAFNKAASQASAFSRAEIELRNEGLLTTGVLTEQIDEIQRLATAAAQTGDATAIQSVTRQYEGWARSLDTAARSNEGLQRRMRGVEQTLGLVATNTNAATAAMQGATGAAGSLASAQAALNRLGLLTGQQMREQIAQLEQLIESEYLDIEAKTQLIALTDQLKTNLTKISDAQGQNAVALNAGRFAFQNFSFAVQDAAQFGLGFNAGMRAIANNLDSIIFALTQADAAIKAHGGSWKEVTKTILAGPVGILIFVNVITSLIQILPKLQEKLGRATLDQKRFNEALFELVNLEREFASVQVSTVEGAEKVSKRILEAIELRKAEAESIRNSLNPLRQLFLGLGRLQPSYSLAFKGLAALTDQMAKWDDQMRGVNRGVRRYLGILDATVQAEEQLNVELKKQIALWQAIEKAQQDVVTSLTPMEQAAERSAGRASEVFKELMEVQLDNLRLTGKLRTGFENLEKQPFKIDPPLSQADAAEAARALISTRANINLYGEAFTEFTDETLSAAEGLPKAFSEFVLDLAKKAKELGDIGDTVVGFQLKGGNVVVQTLAELAGGAKTLAQTLTELEQQTGLTGDQLTEAFFIQLGTIKQTNQLLAKQAALKVGFIRDALTENEVINERVTTLQEETAIQQRRARELRGARLRGVVIQEQFLNLLGEENEITERQIALNNSLVQDGIERIAAAEELVSIQEKLEQSTRRLAAIREGGTVRQRSALLEQQVDLNNDLFDTERRLLQLRDRALKSVRIERNELDAILRVEEELVRLRETSRRELLISLDGETDILEEQARLQQVRNRLLEDGGRARRLLLATLRNDTAEQREKNILLAEEVRLLGERNREVVKSRGQEVRGEVLSRAREILRRGDTGDFNLQDLLKEFEGKQLDTSKNALEVAKSHKEVADSQLDTQKAILQVAEDFDLDAIIRAFGSSSAVRTGAGLSLEVPEVQAADAPAVTVKVESPTEGLKVETPKLVGSVSELTGKVEALNKPDLEDAARMQLDVQRSILRIVENLTRQAAAAPTTAAAARPAASLGETPPGQRGAPPGGFTADTNVVRAIGQAIEQGFEGLDVSGQFRDPATNAATPGASPTSRHLEAMALDITGSREKLTELANTMRELPGVRRAEVEAIGTSREHLHIAFTDGIADVLEAMHDILPGLREALQGPPAHFESRQLIPEATRPPGIPDGQPTSLGEITVEAERGDPAGADRIRQSSAEASKYLMDLSNQSQQVRDAINLAWDDVFDTTRLSTFGAHWRTSMDDLRAKWQSATGEMPSNLRLVVNELFLTAEGVTLLADTAASALNGIGQHFMQTAKDGEKVDKKRFEQGKRIAIAGAIISTAAGVMNAYRYHDPITASVLSAGIIATGALQVAKIKATKPGSGGSVGQDSFSASPDVFAQLPQGALTGGSSNQPAFIYGASGGAQQTSGPGAPSTSVAAAPQAPALPAVPVTPAVPQQAVTVSLSPLDIVVRLEGETRTAGRDLVTVINQEVRAQKNMGVTIPLG